MIKEIKKVGNSHALILDKAICEQMGIREGSKVQVILDGRLLHIAPEQHLADDGAFDAALDRAFEDYGEALKKLA